MISRDRSDNITALLRWTSEASSAFRSMGLVPIMTLEPGGRRETKSPPEMAIRGRGNRTLAGEPRSDVIIGLARNNLEFRDLSGRADSCRLAHKAWIEHRLRPQLPPAGAVSLRSPEGLFRSERPSRPRIVLAGHVFFPEASPARPTQA
jgi:hypothetical protein